MKALETALLGTMIGAPVTLDNLTMFPLFGASAGAFGYLTLEEALQARVARVTEVSAHGSVPELRFVNDADVPVLLLDGEELTGAKQNRIINLSIMVAAHSDTVIPVSCVEAGRWHHQSEEFSSAERAHFSRGRAEKTAQVSASMCADGSRFSDQGAIWNNIQEKSARMQTRSSTGAAAAMYEANSAALQRFVEGMTAASGQSGAAFAINGELVGMDLFDLPQTLARQLKKLVTSYALDAIDEKTAASPVAQATECRAMIDAALAAERSHFKAVGMGEDIRLDGAGIKGGGLLVDGRLVHLCAFRVVRSGERASGSGLLRASRRRNLH